jgi:long-chain acyl-CoA synthetase
MGLGEGDGIAVVMPNSIEMLALYFAAMQAGWYLTPINHHLVGPEIAYIVDDCDAKVFVGHERFAEACANAAGEFTLGADRCFAIGDVAGFRPFDDLVDGQPDTAPDNRTAGQPMHYTSGTTGRPKGVRRQLSGLVPDDAGMLFTFLLQMFGIQPGDGHVHICGSPLYHTAVLAFASSSVHLGHPVVLMDKWTPEAMLASIDRYGVTHSHMVPTQFNRLLALPPAVRDRYDVSSLRNMIHAAAPCPIEVKRQMLEWWGPVIYEYYAMTETGIVALCNSEDWLEHPGTIGHAAEGIEIRIVDEQGNDCPTGSSGQICVCSETTPYVAYHRAEKKTEELRRDLEALGYICRTPDPDDARQATLALTPRGVRLREDSIASVDDLSAVFREILGVRGLATLESRSAALYTALGLKQEVLDAIKAGKGIQHITKTFGKLGERDT